MAADVNKLRCHIFSKKALELYAEMYGITCPEKDLSITRAINYEFIYSRRIECEVVDGLVCQIEAAIKKLPSSYGCLGDNLDCGITSTIIDPDPSCGGTITIVRIS